MPVTVGAIRKLRADGRKVIINSQVRSAFREAVLTMRKKPTAANLVKAYRTVDRAAKKRVITKNKAGRLKSRLARLVVKKK